MEMDGGGWSLVWKHSYREVGPIIDAMRYYSSHFRACTDLETGWCNVPDKARFNPSEMAIAAYHNKILIYAYKGLYNANLDYNWSGGILMDPVKLLDDCRSNRDVFPEPINEYNLGGLAFDKHHPYRYHSNCDTLTKGYEECRWRDCRLNGRPYSDTQMTYAIYVR